MTITCTFMSYALSKLLTTACDSDGSSVNEQKHTRATAPKDVKYIICGALFENSTVLHDINKHTGISEQIPPTQVQKTAQETRSCCEVIACIRRGLIDVAFISFARGLTRR